MVLEVYGPLDPERRGNGATTNAIYMLMPGTAADTVMKVRMGSVEDDELPRRRRCEGGRGGDGWRVERQRVRARHAAFGP